MKILSYVVPFMGIVLHDMLSIVLSSFEVVLVSSLPVRMLSKKGSPAFTLSSEPSEHCDSPSATQTPDIHVPVPQRNWVSKQAGKKTQFMWCHIRTCRELCAYKISVYKTPLPENLVVLLVKHKREAVIPHILMCVLHLQPKI